jgi:hypothetical protein
MSYPLLVASRLLVLGAGSLLLVFCQAPTSPVVVTPTKIFTKHRQFVYTVVHRAPDSTVTQLDTVSFTCYDKFEPRWRVDTTQIRLGWSYTGTVGHSDSSGVRENDTAVWSHPPRNGEYAILEINPFTYVRFPLKSGAEWDWNLEVGEQ